MSVEKVEKTETYQNFAEKFKSKFGRDGRNIPIFDRESRNIKLVPRPGIICATSGTLRTKSVVRLLHFMIIYSPVCTQNEENNHEVLVTFAALQCRSIQN